MAQAEIQYVCDADGTEVGVLIPIELWRAIESEIETAHLLKRETMKQRLLEAKERRGGIPFEEACARLGI